ncbi:MAG: CBS domain-containing protein [Acidimicrobiales bacterium]
MTTREQSPSGEVEIDEFGIGTDLEISALSNDRIVDAPADISLRGAAAIMDEQGIGLLVLKDGAKVAGVVSERDIVKAVGAGLDANGPAAEVGNGQAIHRATATSTVAEVAREMMENYVRHVLITGPDGELTGVVSVRDLLAVLVD